MSTPQAQPLTLAGKVAIVTGGSRGIGAAAAVELAKRDAKVAITFISPSSEELADEVIPKIKVFENGSSAVKPKADMRDLSSPDKIIKETTAVFGTSIDILVNSAGVELIKPPGQITEEAYAGLIEVNVRSAISMTQAVLPYLRSLCQIPGASAYSATKAAVEALARGWASELDSAGYTVNAVAPALTETNMMTGTTAGNESWQGVQMHKMLTPLEHGLERAEDIALVVAMLAEASSRWITG